MDRTSDGAAGRLATIFAISETLPLDHATAAIGRPVAHIVALRRISRSVAIMLQTGPDAMPQPAIVNDL
jgi:hypothetical protein